MNENICVGIGLIVWNGEKTILKTLNSILNQSHKNIILYVLDNQSDDSTVDLIHSLCKTDIRIKLIIDTSKRDIASAQKYIFEKFLSLHDYCMFVCDDDLYDFQFISLVLNKLVSSNLDLVYCLHHNFDEHQNISFNKKSAVYSVETTNVNNTLKFIWYRNCIPIFFGIFNVHSLKKSFSYFRMIDNYGFNHENLMLVHFILNNKVDYIKIDLFGYFLKERISLYFLRGYNFSVTGYKKMIYSNLNQINFTVELFKLIFKQKDVLILNKLILMIILASSYLKFSLGVTLLNFIRLR
jgi:glycosyltransferase involved in cell wall biosynthesis